MTWFQGSTKQLCLTQQYREGKNSGKTRGHMEQRNALSSYRAQLSAVCEEHGQLQSQESAKKENQEPSHGTDNKFAQPAVPCQTTETFMGTQKATGAISLEEKHVPAEPSSLEPSQRPLLSPASPVSAPAAAASCGKEEFCTLQLWMFAGICHSLLSWRLHPQLCHKPCVQPKPTHTYIYIYININTLPSNQTHWKE